MTTNPDEENPLYERIHDILTQSFAEQETIHKDFLRVIRNAISRGDTAGVIALLDEALK